MKPSSPKNKETFIQPDATPGNGDGKRGLALVWLIITMTTVSVIGAAMVSLYTTTNQGPSGTHAISVANLMAESGRRFLVAEYGEQSDEIDKNKLLDELTGKTFGTGAGENSRFDLDVTSYFYRIRHDPGGSGTLRLKMIGTAGFNPTGLSSGYLRIEGEDDLYSFSGTPIASDDGDSKMYTFSVSPAVPSTDEYTGVYSVVRSDIAASVTEGGTLSLDPSDSSLGIPFPEKNGMFIVEKQKIMANMPVPTKVAYRYETRNGNDFVNVTAAPGQSRFIRIDAGSDIDIEAAKFFELSSKGYFGTDPDDSSTLEGARTYTYQLAAPSQSAVKGLRSFWTFDDSSNPTADEYGQNAGTAEGETPPVYTAEGRVGGALAFSGLGTVSTTFNPATEIGDLQPFAIVFWAKPDTVVTYGLRSFQIVFGSQGTSGNKQLYVGFMKLLNQEVCEWRIAYGDLAFNTRIDVSENEWQHIAYIFDGTNLMVYKNGRLGWNWQYTGSGDISDVEVRLGGLASSAGSAFFEYSGLLDEAAIFNRSLTRCETVAVYRVGFNDQPCFVGCDAEAFYPINGDVSDNSGEDKTGNGHAGTIVGAPTMDADHFGTAGLAYNFDGTNDYVTVPHDSALEMSAVSDRGRETDEVSVAAWVKKDAAQSGWIAIVQKSDQSYNLQFANGNQPAFTVYDGAWQTAYSGITAHNGLWYYIVGTYDGTDVKIYVNGEEKGSGTNATYINSATSYDIGIGANLGFTPPDRHLRGSLEDIGIWDRALCPDEILEYYEATAE